MPELRQNFYQLRAAYCSLYFDSDQYSSDIPYAGAYTTFYA